MKRVATAAARERADLFLVVAEARGMAPALMEKDFWVCWTLGRLFTLPGVAPHLLFKGGTTLSKVYGVIRRFSEDIDISLSREFVRPDNAEAVELAPSRTRREKEVRQLKEAFEQKVAHVVHPGLRAAIAEELGPAGWRLDTDDRDAGTLMFTYPEGIGGPESAATGYTSPVVRIEMGGRSDVWPHKEGVVTPYAAEVEPGAFEAPNVAVRVLAVERTFWEKATLLHNEYHRPPTKGRGDRVSRHYSDLSLLARHPEIGPRSLAALDVAERVVHHKTLYYPDTWSRYGDALTGGLRLVPPPDAAGDLRRDYARMRPMFFEDPQNFDAVLAELARVETAINQRSL